MAALPGAAVLDTYGSYDVWLLSVTAEIGPNDPAIGLIIEPTAANNKFITKEIRGGIADASGGANVIL